MESTRIEPLEDAGGPGLRSPRLAGVPRGVHPPDMPRRHRADRSLLDDFADEVLVECPACRGPATVRLHPLEEERRAGPYRARQEGRMSCTACGRSERRTAFVRWIHGPADTVFGHPVWLRTRCRGNTLWAYNARHLDALEAFVGAGLRERRPGEGGTWMNRAWTSRIPRWLTSAKNRDEVLRCIARLRKERLGGRSEGVQG